MAAVNQSNSFNTSVSTVSWINATNVTANFIRGFDYHTTSNTAFIHLKIIVPQLEPEGTKSTYITFNWIEK
jgi:hypothetical protein